MKTIEVVVRPLKDLEEYFACEGVQARIWGFQGVGPTPVPLLRTAHKNGGLVLGAFAGEEMVGMLFGFLGFEDRTGGRVYKHCSHMMGVVPEWRQRDVGHRLKLAQREWVLGQGLDLVTWTHDPLEGPNANLNFAKLGVVCRTYLSNVYGEMRDALNVGLPTDRFQVEWWIRSRRVGARLAGEGPPPSLEALLAEGVPCATRVSVHGKALEAGLPPAGADLTPLILEGYRLDLEADRLLVEVHPHTATLRRGAREQALGWRLGVREVLTHYFERGYWAVEFLTALRGQARRNYYLLRRRFSPV